MLKPTREPRPPPPFAPPFEPPFAPPFAPSPALKESYSPAAFWPASALPFTALLSASAAAAAAVRWNDLKESAGASAATSASLIRLYTRAALPKRTRMRAYFASASRSASLDALDWPHRGARAARAVRAGPSPPGRARHVSNASTQRATHIGLERTRVWRRAAALDGDGRRWTVLDGYGGRARTFFLISHSSFPRNPESVAACAK